jgi:hypothetical protein
MQPARSTAITLFSNIIKDHTAVNFSSCHKFNNYLVIEIRLLHRQPFINSHFHFPIILGSAASEVFDQCYRNSSFTGSGFAAALMGWVSQRYHHHGCSFDHCHHIINIHTSLGDEFEPDKTVYHP